MASSPSNRQTGLTRVHECAVAEIPRRHTRLDGYLARYDARRVVTFQLTPPLDAPAAGPE